MEDMAARGGDPTRERDDTTVEDDIRQSKAHTPGLRLYIGMRRRLTTPAYDDHRPSNEGRVNDHQMRRRYDQQTSLKSPLA